MGRPIVLSNGEMHVGINKFGMVHDFYFPYVGLENHSAGPNTRHRVGVWVDGRTHWLDSPDWVFTFSYPHGALVGVTTATNESIGVLLEFDDVVDTTVSAFIRNIHVVNLHDELRHIRLFMHQAFIIGDARSNTDTAQYLPDSDALLHYRGRRAFIISGNVKNEDESFETFDQHSIGLFGIEGHEGTWRDAEDGELSNSMVEHGQVDSTIRFSLTLSPFGSRRVHYWIAAGTSLREALGVHKIIVEDGADNRLSASAKWWHEWLAPAEFVAGKLLPEFKTSFIQSVMLIKSQIDKRGAVIASTDSTMLNYSRDAYAYCWPRDGANVVWPLIRMGYVDEPRQFFEFIKRGLHPNGYVMHKYRADGALGSSWHPYAHDDGSVTPPIQEDETALTLFVFAQFYDMHKDYKLLASFYESMVVPMADFMDSFIDESTYLPRPTYDLWEEVYITSTYTVGIVYAALIAAAELADAASDPDRAVRWKSTAESIQSHAQELLFNKTRNAFFKGIHGKFMADDTIDISSFQSAFMFGLFPSDSAEIKQAATTIESLDPTHTSDNTALKLGRYENDTYYRQGNNATSNYWFICSLWMAQYYLEIENLDKAYAILRWVRDCASTTGVLSEQIDPVSNEPLSVAPLTWSQSEYVSTLLDTVTEKNNLNYQK